MTNVLDWRHRNIAIDSRFLLAINAIIPLSFLVIVLDTSIWGGAVKQFLPHKPEDYAWFSFIFNLPHIVASFVTYADRDYVRHYKWQLARSAMLCITISSALAFFISPTFFFMCFSVFTIYHLIMQQYGISLMLMKRRPNLIFQFWRWLSLAAGASVFLGVYRPEQMIDGTNIGWETGGYIMLFLSIPFAILFYWQEMRGDDISRTSKAYYVMSCLIVVAACFASSMGYPFIMVMIPRFIHDGTAFTFYAVHDHNRNLETSHNWLYRVLRPLHISPLVLCLPLSIALTWYFAMHEYDSLPVMIFLLFITLVHFHMEGYMWKRDTPHRKHVSFKVA